MEVTELVLGIFGSAIDSIDGNIDAVPKPKRMVPVHIATTFRPPTNITQRPTMHRATSANIMIRAETRLARGIETKRPRLNATRNVVPR